MTDPIPPGQHDLADVATQLGLTEDEVTALARAGALPATWVPSRRAFYVTDADLAAYRAAHQ